MQIMRRNLMATADRNISRLQRLNGRIATAQEQAVTGLSVNRPSDAPGRWQQIHGLQSASADHQVWQENLDRAQDLLDTTDNVLSAASTVMQQAWERAIQLSSETYDLESRTQAAGEIRGLRDALISLANSDLGGRSLFAGDASDQAAFDTSGAYLGGPVTGAIRIGQTDEVAAAFDGQAVFQGGVDVFQVLSDLEAALAADDPTAVAGLLTDLEAGYQQLVLAREEVGYRQDRVDDARLVSEGLAATFDNRLTQAIEADPSAAYTELLTLQVSYQAALQVTAGTSGAKLFDFIR